MRLTDSQKAPTSPQCTNSYHQNWPLYLRMGMALYRLWKSCKQLPTVLHSLSRSMMPELLPKSLNLDCCRKSDRYRRIGHQQRGASSPMSFLSTFHFLHASTRFMWCCMALHNQSGFWVEKREEACKLWQDLRAKFRPKLHQASLSCCLPIYHTRLKLMSNMQFVLHEILLSENLSPVTSAYFHIRPIATVHSITLDIWIILYKALCLSKRSRYFDTLSLLLEHLSWF